jgi:hypothetical protein
MQTIVELTAFQRIFYKLVTPLLIGTGLFAAFAFPIFNLLRDGDAPEWMRHVAFRIAVAAFILGYMGWLSSRVAQVSLWVKVEEGSLHFKSLWTGRVRVKAIADIRRAGVWHGGLVGPWIEFKDGQRWRLEGRLGPGIKALSTLPAAKK